MGLLNYDASLNVLLATKGHPFERDALAAVFESWPDIACTHVEQPAAQAFFSPEAAEPWDAYVLYDMPGIEFRPGDGPRFIDPPEAYQERFLALLEAGHGFVFLHHAIAGWPTWPEYAEIVGGRFHYEPALLRGVQWPDSGYRHSVTHRVTPVGEHPVLAGLEDGYEIEDEVYLCPIFEDDVTPLLRSDHTFEAGEFYSAALAVRGELYSNRGWSHPAGSNLAAWCHRKGASPIVYIAGGDNRAAYENPGFRRLIENAIRWVASDEAKAWARGEG